MDALDSALVQEIMTNHSVECIVSQDPTWGNVVRPIGSIGLGALCNEKDLFIVDKVVVKLVGGYIISCPMDKYAYLPSFAEWNDDVMLTLMSQIVSGQIPQISDDEIVIYKLNQQSQDDSDSPQKHHVATHGNYKLVVDIDAYPVWQWFMQTSVRGEVDIYNYYNGSRSKVKTLGLANFKTHVVCSVESIDTFVSCAWGVQAITGKYKHKAFRNGQLLCGRPRVSRTVVELERIRISIDQERGARIDYSYN